MTARACGDCKLCCKVVREFHGGRLVGAAVAKASDLERD